MTLPSQRHHLHTRSARAQGTGIKKSSARAMVLLGVLHDTYQRGSGLCRAVKRGVTSRADSKSLVLQQKQLETSELVILYMCTSSETTGLWSAPVLLGEAVIVGDDAAVPAAVAGVHHRHPAPDVGVQHQRAAAGRPARPAAAHYLDLRRGRRLSARKLFQFICSATASRLLSTSLRDMSAILVTAMKICTSLRILVLQESRQRVGVQLHQ